eukprot:2156298-Rhodomonas_salina.1
MPHPVQSDSICRYRLRLVLRWVCCYHQALGPEGLLKESRGSVTITDPDGYWIELNKRGGYGEAAALYE